jgi:predicted ATPase/DNA-binding SARP family transcriptional activator
LISGGIVRNSVRPAVHLALFGPPQLARADGSPLALRSRKHLALLIFLTIEHGPSHSRDALLALLWPEAAEAAARNNLRVALADLRQALGAAGAELLQTTRHTIQFSAPDDHIGDVPAFRALLAAVQAHGHAAVERCPACLEQLEQATALYRGDFLHGFGLPDSAPFEEWAAFQREQLHQQQLAALETLTAAAHLRGDHAGQVAYGRRMLALEPWREAAHDQVIRGLWALGERTAALKQYEACCRILADELGLAPSPELVALAELLHRPPSADAPATGPWLAAESTPEAWPIAPAPAPTLPVALTPLVGRERELVELTELLQRPEVRILTLIGVGGMGKTRLAQELGHVCRAAFADGVVFVPLAPLTDPAAIAPAILAALDEHPGSGDPLQIVLSRLRPRRLLLILDNFEHLLDGAALVTTIAEAAPQVTVLATSRERLNLRGEHQYLLGGLAVADDDATPALRLFAERARRVRPSFSIAPTNRAAVLQICRMVDGMPLGIELAATWIETLAPDEIAAEIAHNLDFLAAEWRDLPERQRSMRAVFDWSWQRLSAAERQVFARLAVFRGGFTRQAAQAVAGATLPVLSRLLHKALVQPDALSGRYTLHELLRQFADEHVQRSPDDAAATRERHLTFFLELAERGDPTAPRDVHEAWLADLARDHDNLRAALAYCLQAAEQGNADRVAFGLRIAGAVWPFWQHYCYLGEGRAWLEQLLARAPDDDVAPLVRANALYGAGWLAHDQDDFPSADAFFAAGLRLDEALEKTDRVAQVLAHRGIMARGQGRYGAAIALVEESLALARAAGNLAGIAYALFRLGVIVRECGQFDRAAALYEECLGVYRALDDRRGAAFCLLGFADIARDQGEPEVMQRYSAEALAVGRAIEQPWVIGFALNNLALAALMQGELERAAALGDEALTLFHMHDIRGGVVEALITAGQIAAASGACAQAREQFVEGVRRGWTVGPYWLVAAGLEELAHCLGPLPDAVRLYGAAHGWRCAMGVSLPAYRRTAYASALATARAALGEQQFTALWAEGAAWPPERAVAVALELG